MAHETCPQCGHVVYGDSSEIGRMMKEHVRRAHEQGYRGSSSWIKCGVCGGSGKNTWGGDCSNCGGSGVL